MAPQTRSTTRQLESQRKIANRFLLHCRRRARRARTAEHAGPNVKTRSAARKAKRCSKRRSESPVRLFNAVPIITVSATGQGVHTRWMTPVDGYDSSAPQVTSGTSAGQPSNTVFARSGSYISCIDGPLTPLVGETAALSSFAVDQLRTEASYRTEQLYTPRASPSPSATLDYQAFLPLPRSGAPQAQGGLAAAFAKHDWSGRTGAATRIVLGQTNASFDGRARGEQPRIGIARLGLVQRQVMDRIVEVENNEEMYEEEEGEEEEVDYGSDGDTEMYVSDTEEEKQEKRGFPPRGSAQRSNAEAGPSNHRN